MWMVKVEKVTADYGRYVGTEVYYYNKEENAEKRATEERKNKMTNGTVVVEKVVTED